MKYSFKKTLTKVVKYFLIFIIPFAVDKWIIAFPEFFQLSAGAILVGIVNWLKVKANVRLGGLL